MSKQDNYILAQQSQLTQNTAQLQDQADNSSAKPLEVVVNVTNGTDVGLVNVGKHTCYMLAIFQAIRPLTEFTNLLEKNIFAKNLQG